MPAQAARGGDGGVPPPVGVRKLRTGLQNLEFLFTGLVRGQYEQVDPIADELALPRDVMVGVNATAWVATSSTVAPIAFSRVVVRHRLPAS
jgi:hypothetical protein